MKRVLLFSMLLVVYAQQAKAADLITRWDLSKPGAFANQLVMGMSSTGIVNYTWETIPAGASGFGTGSGATLYITGLPSNAQIRLKIDTTNFKKLSISNGPDRQRLMDVEQWGDMHWNSMWGAFYGCSNLNISATDIPDLSGVSTMQDMFWGCAHLNGPSNINNWNTSTITNMSGLFLGDSLFNQTIGNWNTSNVTNMSVMFYEAVSFNQNINTWDVSQVTTFEEMFYFATSFNQPLANWNTSSATTMRAMFTKATSFNQAINTWNTSNVTHMGDMFSFASSFNQPLANWDVSNVHYTFGMFKEAVVFNQNLNSWNTANIYNLISMFEGASSFNQPVSLWNTSMVTTMNSMFMHATSFNQSLSSWNVSNAYDLFGMFWGASGFNQSLGDWNLHPNVYLVSFLDSSGLDCARYSATLSGWATNPTIPSGRNLTASGLSYGINAATDRNFLLASKGWTITGDNSLSSPCFNSPTDRDGLEEMTFDISPNPCSNFLQLRWNANNAGPAQIILLDMVGNIIQSKNFNHLQGLQMYKMSLENVRPGFYLLQIKAGNKMATKFLSIER